MASGLFTLKQQLQGLIQKAWSGQTPATYSGAFNGVVGLPYISTPTSTNLVLGTSTFTLEFWINKTDINTSGQTPVSFGNFASYDPLFGYNVNSSGGQLVMFLSSNGSAWDIASSVAIGTTALNTWYHIAIVRNGTTFTTYLNGVQGATFTSSASIYQSANSVIIGKGQSSSFYGLMSNVRFVKGTAVYTSAFTPPTSPLTAITNTQLLTLQNSTLVDNSSNAFSLAITNSSGFSLTNTNPFNTPNVATPAVEYLVVAGGGGASAGGGGAGGLLQGLSNVTAGTSLTVTVGSGGASSTGNGTNGTNSVFSNITALGGGGGGWRSVTSALSGGSGGGSNADNAGAGGQGTFGQGNAGGNNPNSYNRGGGGGGAGTVGSAPAAAGVDSIGGSGIASGISGAITVYSAGGAGTATAASGAANTGNGAVGSYGSPSGAGGSGIVIISYPDTYNAPSALTGTYTASTSGTGSILFNGSSQYITTPTSANLALGTSNFSVEAWVYKTSTSGNQLAIGTSVTGNLDPILLYFNSGSNNAVFYLSSNGSTFDIASAVSIGTVSLNTWAHLAVTRVGSTFTTYLNGVQTSTFTSSASIYKSVNTFTLGAGQTSFNYFNGYMSNVRIVIGSSAYSAPFTPSTTPLTPITNTQLLFNTVSGAQFADSSTNSFASTATNSPTWNQLSPFATGLGYKKRVYTWTASGTVTF